MALSTCVLHVQCNTSQKAIHVIYVYNDSGVSEECYIQTVQMLVQYNKSHETDFLIQTIDAEGVIKGLWCDNALLFIMPGGADCPYCEKLNGEGNSVIKNYVKNGGSYLGICAGSYYGTSFIEFDKEGPYEVIGPRELQFFSGKGIGPLVPYDYRDNSGARAAPVQVVINGNESWDINIYYNGGPHFENSPNTNTSEVEVIGNYKFPSLPSWQAILKIKYGKGKVLLSGVHFEYNPDNMDSDDPYCKIIIPLLEETNDKRILLIEDLFDFLIKK